MQPKTYQQIYDELGSVYDPQTSIIRQQEANIPGQIQSEEQGLQAKQTQAYNDILNGARQRGLGFGGIPLADQAKYSATDYMPALARLHQSGQDQATSLEQAIQQINEKRSQQAQGNYQYESTLAENRRQADMQNTLAHQQLSANSFSPTFDPSQLPAGPKTGSATAMKRADGGFNYVDANGRPISAASYAITKGLSFRQVLQEAAKQGDKGAQTALGFVGDDFGYDPRKISSPQLANLYNALVWGTGKSASYKPAPAPKTILPAGYNPFAFSNPLALNGSRGLQL